MLTIFQINNTHPSFWFLEFRNTHNRTHINSDPENHILDDPEMSSKHFEHVPLTATVTEAVDLCPLNAEADENC